MRSLKTYLLIVGLCGFGVYGCSSTPTPDPDTGVSNASYRLCIAKSEQNVAGVVSKMQVLRDMDQSGMKAHTADWWSAQIDLMVVTQRLLHDTLLGSSK